MTIAFVKQFPYFFSKKKQARKLYCDFFTEKYDFVFYKNT